VTRSNSVARLESFVNSRALRIESLEDRRLLTLAAELVQDINPGVTDSMKFGARNALLGIDDTLYLLADDGISGFELWKSDGTQAGTTRVADIRAGAGTSYPEQLTDVNGVLFFSAFNDVTGRELWKSNGTESGTVQVKDIQLGVSPFGERGSYPRYLTSFEGKLFFSADDGFSGRELWASDGTESGTVLLADIIQGFGSGSHPLHLTKVDDTLYFIADDGVSGYEIWKSDGTQAGTALVKDIQVGKDPYGQLGSDAYGLTDVAGTLYFSAHEGRSGYELWKSDGTEAGTMRVKDIRLGVDRIGRPGSYPFDLTNVTGTLFFQACDGSGCELWKSDGTEAGTIRVRDIFAGSGESFPEYLTDVDGTLYFRANDGVDGYEIWKSDGTEIGTIQLKDIRPNGSSNPEHLASLQGLLFFTADDGIHGKELWVSDGTEAGTYMVEDLFTGSSGAAPTQLTAVGHTLYFTADDGIHGRELWKVVVEGEAVPGDTDADGDVDLEDLNNVRNHFGEIGDGATGDTFPFDGDVDLDDVNAVRNNFGATSSLSSGLLAMRNAPTRAIGHDDSALASLAGATRRAETLRSDHVQAAFDHVHAYAAGVWQRCNEALADSEVEAPWRLAIAPHARRSAKR